MMRRTVGRRLTILVGVAAVAAACVRMGTLPPIEYYSLAIERGTDDGVAPIGDPVLRGTLAIEPVDAPGIYGDGGIVFRLGDTQLHAYPSRQWAMPLGDMLGQATESVLASDHLTAERPLFDPPRRESYTYIWRSRVREFEEVNRGTQVLAAVGLEAMLLASATDSVIWTGSARLERGVAEPTMPAIVRMLSDLTVEVVGRLADSARVALRVPTAAMARPPD